MTYPNYHADPDDHDLRRLLETPPDYLPPFLNQIEPIPADEGLTMPDPAKFNPNPDVYTSLYDRPQPVDDKTSFWSLHRAINERLDRLIKDGDKEQPE